MLDLRIPVRSLYETHRNFPPRLPRQFRQPANDFRRTLAVGLDNNAQAMPVVQAFVRRESLENIERQLEAVRLLGIDCQIDAMRCRMTAQREYAITQLGEHTRPLCRLVARMQCGQLYRYRGAHAAKAFRIDAGYRGNRFIVVLVVTRRGARIARSFAKHVVRVRLARCAATNGLVDALAKHKLVSENPHGVAHRISDGRFPDLVDQLSQPDRGIVAERRVHGHDTAGQHECPCRGIDEEPIASTQM